MGIQRRIADPAGIVNASGQPEILLEINGLKISLAPTGRPAEQPADASPADGVPEPPAEGPVASPG